MKWLKTFQDKSFCTYWVTRGTKTTGSILIYKTVRHCQHFRKYISRQGIKNTKSIRQKKTQCSQFPNHPCEIQLRYHHNHPIESAHALSFRDVAESTKEAYYSYFQNGHSAATARHELNLLLSLPKDQIPALADRSVNPQASDVSRLFHGMCTCPVGINGQPCKHQYFVASHFHWIYQIQHQYTLSLAGNC